MTRRDTDTAAPGVGPAEEARAGDARRGISFRARLVLFSLAIAGIFAIPLVAMQVRRPWQELDLLIGKSQALLAGIEPAFDPGELSSMTRFALEMTEKHPYLKNPTLPPDHYSQWANSHAFLMLLDEGRLLTPGEVAAVFAEGKLHYTGFSYAELARWYEIWEKELEERPGMQELLGRYRALLVSAAERAGKGGFGVANVYLMADPGTSRSAAFRDRVAILLESLPWWESHYPGEPYDLEKADNLYYRASYLPQLGGKPGFAHNPVSDPSRWYLPRFDTDEWGTWFTCWDAVEVRLDGGGSAIATFNVDFDAGAVKRLMWRTARTLALLLLALLAAMALAVRHFSRWLSRPIEDLTRGAEAVMAREYAHVVPQSAGGEFSRLTEVFNRMIGWVRERVNLKDTLTKILSAELAERAASEGLVLGGQEVQCSIMFTDFAGFSTLVQSRAASEVVEVLNLYFSELVPIVKRHGGFPDKYIGDAIVAIFGAPVPFDDHAEKAVRCAVEMQRRLREVNERRREAGALYFEMRVGIDSGTVLAGAIGCDLKMEYTSIGETTNLANRLESKCRIGHVLISESTRRRVPGHDVGGAAVSDAPEEESVKGYDTPVLAYEIRVHDLEIVKNPRHTSPSDYYIYRPRRPPQEGPALPESTG